MTTIINKFIDKAKPKFAFHRKLEKLDSFVEPPSIGPTDTEPLSYKKISSGLKNKSSSNDSHTKDEQKHSSETSIHTTNYTPFYPEHLPSTPPKTPSNTYNSSSKSTIDECSLSEASSDSEHKNCGQQKVELKLSDFKIQRTLGTGSFGRVHLVQSKINRRYYALKVLKKAEIVQLKQVEHTNDERAILTSIKNHFIVNLWSSFQDDGNLYMVMDYVPGGELFSVLRRSKKFSSDTTRFYAGEVLLAITHLHDNDIIYRDLKPENILLDAHGHIKITDFGFAKRVHDRTWTVCGTPDYLAPEIIQTKGYGKAADYWAFGILIYEMLAGYPPFYDENQFKLYEKILSTQPKYPLYFDFAAKDLLKHLLTTDLTRRYGNLKKGYYDIMEHKWFSLLNFDLLAQRKIKPPYIPSIRSTGDSSNFEIYAEDYAPYGTTQNDPYREKFPDF
ncbi:kinase-like protein [Backusella circina FSU 941]|nr:kinase-like protein [Backusella circina FSU 941]